MPTLLETTNPRGLSGLPKGSQSASIFSSVKCSSLEANSMPLEMERVSAPSIKVRTSFRGTTITPTKTRGSITRVTAYQHCAVLYTVDYTSHNI